VVRIHPAVPENNANSALYEYRHRSRESADLERTHCGPRRTRFAMPDLRLTKRRRNIGLEDVPAVFDDPCIRELANIAKLPADADIGIFGWWIREAACMFACDARVPTVNELHDEIAALHKAAERKRYEQVGDLLDRLSVEARVMLSTLQGELPTSGDLRDKTVRDRVREAVERLCRTGAMQRDDADLLPTSRSRSAWRPHLHAPNPQRHFMKREAERYFVARLSVAWCRVVGRAPPRSVRHRAEREIGPFARFVRRCLDLVGAKYANAAELINAVGRDPFYQRCLANVAGMRASTPDRRDPP
jgi:hypothetical protein